MVISPLLIWLLLVVCVSLWKAVRAAEAQDDDDWIDQ